MLTQFRRLCALITLLMLATACDLRQDYQAALVISDIAAGDAPTRLKSTTAQPRKQAVVLSIAGKPAGGDLYLPEHNPEAAILLLPGAAEKGKDDPRLQHFANSLARAGFAVLVPDLEDFRSLKVSSADIGETADAFSWLIAQKELAPKGKAGIFSFSYASGPAILAALQPRIAGRVSFIMAVGGYHSLPDVLTFFTTGYFRDDGRWRHMEPNSYGKWVFVLSNLARISDPSDRQLFQQAAARKMNNLNASLADLVPRLSGDGRNLYDFLENKDPARALLFMDRLPEQIRREIRSLNVAAYDLRPLKAKLILVHGYEDDIIPYTESVALARSVPKGQARLCLVHGLMHVNLKPGIVDKVRLWRAICALLAKRGDA